MTDAAKTIQAFDDEMLRTTGIHNVYEKTCGTLTLESLFTGDSVRNAAERCACGFRHKPDTYAFMSQHDANSEKLCDLVLDHRFKPLYRKQITIQERGKSRVIRPPRFETKIVQKVICTLMIRPLLEPKMIHSSYASIKGRGIELAYQEILWAINRACRSNPGGVIGMTDYQNYFGSICIDILFEMLGRYILDGDVLSLMHLFSPDPYGLWLGNELSQVPASWFPSPVDHMMKDQMRRQYFRYMDDTLFISPDMKTAMEDLDAVIEKSASLALTIPEKKIRIVPLGQSFKWCKESFVFNRHSGQYYRKMNPSRVARERRVIHAMGNAMLYGDSDDIPEAIDRLQTQWNTVRGSWLSRPNTGSDIADLDELVKKYIDAVS